MNSAQYTRSPKSAKTARKLGVFAACLLAGSGALLSANNAAAAMTRTRSVAATPVWDDAAFRNLCLSIWLILGCDPGYFDANATTPEAAMWLIVDHYATIGELPPLSPEDEAELRQTLSDAEAMLREAPSTLDQTAVKTFLKTISAMWIDLGGYPGDIDQ